MRKGIKWDVVRQLALGVCAAMAVAIGGILLLALLLNYVLLGDNTIVSLNQLIKALCVFVGTWIAVKPGGTQGLLKGAAVGGIFMLLGWMSLLIMQADVLLPGAMMRDILLGTVIGALSGALMANLPPVMKVPRKKMRSA